MTDTTPPRTPESKRKLLVRLLSVGETLSNIAYNWKQTEGYVITKHDCESLGRLQREWDELKKRYREKKP